MRKTRNLRFRHDCLQLGKEYVGFRKSSTPVCLFSTISFCNSTQTFLAHMTSVRQHRIQDVMLTHNFSGKDIFYAINMNVDNFLLKSLTGVATRLKSFLHEKILLSPRSELDWEIESSKLTLGNNELHVRCSANNAGKGRRRMRRISFLCSDWSIKCIRVDRR